MSKSRKQKMIEDLEESIRKAEGELIDTPPEMTQGQYQKIIDSLKQSKKMLEILKKM